jgi:DNA-binding FrmR family transcriptional regulator
MNMQFESNTVEESIRRLKRVEGQIGGVIRMMEDSRECREVFQQVAAATKALERVGFKLLASQLRECVIDEEAATREGYSPQELERLFMSLS